MEALRVIGNFVYFRGFQIAILTTGGVPPSVVAEFTDYIEELNNANGREDD